MSTANKLVHNNRAAALKAPVKSKYKYIYIYKAPIFVRKTFEMLLKSLQRTLNKHIVRLPTVTHANRPKGDCWEVI